MNKNQQAGRNGRWNASNLDREKVFYKFSSEAEEQFKFYIQNLGELNLMKFHYLKIRFSCIRK